MLGIQIHLKGKQPKIFTQAFISFIHGTALYSVEKENTQFADWFLFITAHSYRKPSHSLPFGCTLVICSINFQIRWDNLDRIVGIWSVIV